MATIFQTLSEATKHRPYGRMAIIFFAVVITMAATLQHQASVYLQIIPSKGILSLSDKATQLTYALAVVSVLDLVVLIFTFAGSRLMPAMYALGQAVLTLIYFSGTDSDLARYAAIGVFTVLFALSGLEFAELAYAIWTGKTRSGILSFLRHHLRRNEALFLRQRIADLEADNATLRALAVRVENTAKNLQLEADRKVAETIERLEEENRKALARAEDTLRKNIANAFIAKTQPRWLQEGGEA